MSYIFFSFSQNLFNLYEKTPMIYCCLHTDNESYKETESPLLQKTSFQTPQQSPFNNYLIESTVKPYFLPFSLYPFLTLPTKTREEPKPSLPLNLILFTSFCWGVFLELLSNSTIPFTQKASFLVLSGM